MGYKFGILLALFAGGLVTVAKPQQQANYELAEKFNAFDLGGKLSRNSLAGTAAVGDRRAGGTAGKRPAAADPGLLPGDAAAAGGGAAGKVADAPAGAGRRRMGDLPGGGAAKRGDHPFAAGGGLAGGHCLLAAVDFIHPDLYGAFHHLLFAGLCRDHGIYCAVAAGAVAAAYGGIQAVPAGGGAESAVCLPVYYVHHLWGDSAGTMAAAGAVFCGHCLRHCAFGYSAVYRQRAVFDPLGGVPSAHQPADGAGGGTAAALRGGDGGADVAGAADRGRADRAAPAGDPDGDVCRAEDFWVLGAAAGPAGDDTAASSAAGRLPAGGGVGPSVCCQPRPILCETHHPS